ncbi:MAG: hypothetical protein SVX43_17715, partial [Cyanobacteriota bacterium]|nr:hypothetical protein [Cyanobacteriota bacterium]
MKSETELRKDEFLNYLRYFRSRLSGQTSQKEKFVLFCHHRSGSTLLANLLNVHPQIYCDRELFLPFIEKKIPKVLLPYP